MCLFFPEKPSRKQENYINSFLWKLKLKVRPASITVITLAQVKLVRVHTAQSRSLVKQEQGLVNCNWCRPRGKNVSLLNSMTCDYRLTLFWYLNDVTVSHFAIKTGITVTDRKHVQNYQNKMQSRINESFSLRSGASRVKVANLKTCWMLYWIKIAPSSC